MRITPNTSISNLRAGLGKSQREKRRESESRRKRLEKLARWISGKNVEVEFVKKGASCRPKPGPENGMVVRVPTAEHEQPETELDPSVWDFVFQKAELIHELLHVLYTDFDTHEVHIEKINDMHQKEVFKNIFNIAEDGAIERQGERNYNIGNDLRIKNENLMRKGEPGVERYYNGEVCQELRFHDAFELFLMDKLKFDTGRAKKLMDPTDDDYHFHEPEDREKLLELLPRTWEFRRDVLTEPDGAERVRITYEYFQDVKGDLEDWGEMANDDLLQQLMQNFPDDANVYVVTPGEPPEDAEALEPDDDDVVIQLGGGDKEGDEEEGEGGEEGGPEARYGEQIEADGDDEEEEMDGYESWAESVEETGDHLEVVQDGEAESGHWPKAENRAKRYKSHLKQALQRERESKIKPDQRAGRPDAQNLWKLGYGEGRVFEEEREPDEKDYSVVILLDRSGSMGGDVNADWIVDEAEITASALAMALEGIGAEVAVLSVSGGVSLEKTFEQSTEARKDVMLRNHSKGGTPLGSALELAKDQLEGREGKSLVFSITDGEPTDGYNRVLKEVTFPVVGVYFKKKKPDISDVREYYHRIKASDKENLSGTVEGLIKRMVV